jgi:hypothetical protein
LDQFKKILSTELLFDHSTTIAEWDSSLDNELGAREVSRDDCLRCQRAR